MPVEHHIAMDTHCHTTQICVKTRANTPGRSWQVPTTIPALREAIASVRRPRYLAFEEGPLASWLSRRVREFDVVHIHALFSFAALTAVGPWLLAHAGVHAQWFPFDCLSP